LSLVANDPPWDIGLSLIMAAATYLTAPTVVHDLLVRRRVTVRSVVFWLGSTSVIFDVRQLARTGRWQYEWTLPNFLASSVLYAAAGLVWTVDWRRFWLPAGVASTIGLACLAAWSWP
jgi:hypothetical protein